jgi:hypothetical protein
MAAHNYSEPHGLGAGDLGYGGLTAALRVFYPTSSEDEEDGGEEDDSESEGGEEDDSESEGTDD